MSAAKLELHEIELEKFNRSESEKYYINRENIILQLNHMYIQLYKRNRSLFACLRAGCLDLEIETVGERCILRENKIWNGGIENYFSILSL